MIGLAVLAALVLAVPGSSAADGQRLPPAITGASLKQDGQELVWNVRLRHAFTPSSLIREHASLCLLIERASDGSVIGKACVAPRRRRREPFHLIVTWGRDGRRILDATVTRTTREQLEASFLPGGVGLRYRKLRWQVQSAVSPADCVPPTTRADPCVRLAPSRPRLLKLHTPRPVGCAATGPTFVFHGPSNVHDMALTFDDGPWYDTPQFLSVLEREHVPATFFEIGDQISQYGNGGAIERRMLRDGDMIGDHTWNHQNVAGAGDFARSEILQAADAIRRATRGFTPCLFRAPYGATSPALLSEVRSLGMTTIQWDIDPRDWALPGIGEIESNVLSNAQNGGIVEMHDGGGDRSETVASLPTIIDTLRNRGYRFVTVSQMLGYRLIYK